MESLTKKEIKKLKSLQKRGYFWLVRNKNDDWLYAYANKPIKNYAYYGEWSRRGNGELVSNDLYFVQDVKWTNKNPTVIEHVLMKNRVLIGLDYNVADFELSSDEFYEIDELLSNGWVYSYRKDDMLRFSKTSTGGGEIPKNVTINGKDKIFNENCLISYINYNGTIKMVTLLDYEIHISDYLKSIKLPQSKNETIIVDTVLCSGMNQYRFIKVKLDDKGIVDLNNYTYIEDDDLIYQANNILNFKKVDLECSILTDTQKEKIENIKKYDKNKLIEYKGYYGEVNFSNEDKCFWGTAIGITDLITLEGTTYYGVIKDFQKGIDYYLDICEKRNKEPNKTNIVFKEETNE